MPVVRDTKNIRTRTSISDRARKFTDLAGQIDIASIKELSKSDPQAAYMASQQLEQKLLQEEAEHNARLAKAEQAAQAQQQQSQQLTEGMDGKPEDEIKTEKGLELQAQLPFQKKRQLKNVQALKMEIENQLRARQTSTPKPGQRG